MSREKVLEKLRSAEGSVSGQSLSEGLGLSRAAVWKAVEGLRKEGYVIEARTGLGYRLVSAPDALTEPEIRSHLKKTRTVGRTLYCFAELDSTNNYARTLSQQGAPDGTAVIADCQTAGRGRMNRGFQSPKGKGIYLSVLLRPQLPPERLPLVTALAGVALCDAVEAVCGVRPGLKWPNDPVLNSRKLCGILTEASLEAETGRLQSLIVGIGVNVLQAPEDFSPEVAAMATSLFQATGQAVSRPRLAAAILEALDRMYDDLQRDNLEPWRRTYRADCVNLGKTVQLIPFNGGPRETARAVDVDGDFSLIVQRPDGTRKTVRSGEVSVRGLWGYIE